jgi:hypothetical protein
MPKAMAPRKVQIAGRDVTLNIAPDPFDARDLEYRPRLQALPPFKDVRATDRFVMKQEGSSCVGHAMAAMINAVLAVSSSPTQVSPYMLYRMARRYDEFEGEDDEGSSLRGALKGWFNHGVLPMTAWPSLDRDAEPDLDGDSNLARLAQERPLGAFYRVNAYRLDDMQSAIMELRGIVVSAQIHSGWLEPTLVERAGRRMHLIERPLDAAVLGGHAFAIVGYNKTGFLVQNSWGAEWGGGGFATLPYGDWLESAFDAWVARPGVPTVVADRKRTQTLSTTVGSLGAGAGPDLVRLASHVVNLGNDGRLSEHGHFITTPTNVHRLFQRMSEYHEYWRDECLKEGSAKPPRRIVLYAHGGLVNEVNGLGIAQKHLNWWLNNGVYPITFAWQAGPGETLFDHIADVVREKLPFGFLGFDAVEAADRLVEKVVRARLRFVWAEMKENAAAASEPLTSQVVWPDDDANVSGHRSEPGASLLVERLARYSATIPADESLEVHLVGHSAGAIFIASLLGRLEEKQIPVESLAFLAPAVRLDRFEELVLPRLRSGFVKSFASFGMDDKQELDDVCQQSNVTFYQKSLLYLVARALERNTPGAGVAEVALLGLQRCLDTPLGGRTVAEVLNELNADLVWSPAHDPAKSRSMSDSHGGFDDDSATMTSVLLRILRADTPTPRFAYQEHVPLLVPDSAIPRHLLSGAAAPIAPAGPVAEAAPTGTSPLTRMAAQTPDAEQAAATEEIPVAGITSASSPVMIAVEQDGWTRVPLA